MLRAYERKKAKLKKNRSGGTGEAKPCPAASAAYAGGIALAIGGRLG